MSEITKVKLEKALDRLLNGVPLRTKADGKIGLSRINNEAGLSSGAIYYSKYNDFVSEAKKKIKEHKNKRKAREEKDKAIGEMSEFEILKAKLEHANRLKNKYRQEKKEQQAINDGLVAQNTALAFRVYEQECEIRQITQGRVTPIMRHSI